MVNITQIFSSGLQMHPLQFLTHFEEEVQNLKYYF